MKGFIMKNAVDSSFSSDSKIANNRYKQLDTFQDRGHDIGYAVGKGIANFSKSSTNMVAIIFVGSVLFILNMASSMVSALIDSFIPVKRSKFDSIN
jgi:hypothetical protein